VQSITLVLWFCGATTTSKAVAICQETCSQLHLLTMLLC
jgi:hypothetical protein